MPIHKLILSTLKCLHRTKNIKSDDFDILAEPLYAMDATHLGRVLALLRGVGPYYFFTLLFGMFMEGKRLGSLVLGVLFYYLR